MITTSLEKHLGSVHAAQQAKQLRSVLIYTTTQSLFPTRGVTFQVQKLGTTKLQIIFTSNTFSLQKKSNNLSSIFTKIHCLANYSRDQSITQVNFQAKLYKF